MIYFGILLGIVVTAFLCNKKIKISHSIVTGKKIYIILWGSILVLLVALRSTQVGNDTKMYEYIFNSLKQSSLFGEWMKISTFTSGTEYGFYFSAYLISRVFEFRIFLIFMALLSILPVIFVIYKYSDNVSISLMLYVCFAYYTFSMSGLRQSGALGFIMIAYYFMKEKRVIPYILFCIIAFSFHSSALLFLPVYWLVKIPNNWITRFLSIFAIAGCYVLRSALWNIASQFARQNYDVYDAGGRMMYLFMILSVILGLYYKKRFADNNGKQLSPSENVFISDKELLYLQILAVMICPLSSVNAAISRIYYYYHIFFVLYVPNLLQSINKKNEKTIILIGYVVVALYFLLTQVFAKGQSYYPYYFMWQ